LSQVQLNYDERRQPSQQGRAILEVSNLTVEFAKSGGGGGRTGRFSRKSWIKAVDNVSFMAYDSEILAIVGESGSGKSTIARCILSLTRPTRGSIRYNGVEVTKLRGRDLLKYRKDVQIIFQDPFESLNPRHDVLAALSLPLRRLAQVKGRDAVRVSASNLLKEVGLDPSQVLHRFPHQLSGGQRQRVNIARALASNPRLLIADEPITMLDAAQRLKILSLLYELKEKRKLTVLMITHDLASTKIVSDRTLVMYLGKVVELGRTEAVLAKPHHPYVNLIMESTPSFDFEKQLAKELQVAPSADATVTTSIEDGLTIKKGCAFLPRCKYSTAVCAEADPELAEKSPSHFTACHNPLNKSLEAQGQ